MSCALLEEAEVEGVGATLSQNDCSEIATTVARLYKAYPSNPKQWEYTKAMGAVTFYIHQDTGAVGLKLISLSDYSVALDVPWESVDGYVSLNDWFHAFEMPGAICGLSFADEEGARDLLDAIEENAPKKGKKSFMKRVKGFFGSGKETSAAVDVSTPTDFEHKAHIGWSDSNGFEITNMSDEWKALLAGAGISEAELKDPSTAKVVLDVISQTLSMDPQAAAATLGVEPASAPPAAAPNAASAPMAPKRAAPPPPPRKEGPPTAPKPKGKSAPPKPVVAAPEKKKGGFMAGMKAVGRKISDASSKSNSSNQGAGNGKTVIASNAPPPPPLPGNGPSPPKPAGAPAVTPAQMMPGLAGALQAKKGELSNTESTPAPSAGAGGGKVDLMAAIRAGGNGLKKAEDRAAPAAPAGVSNDQAMTLQDILMRAMAGRRVDVEGDGDAEDDDDDWDDDFAQDPPSENDDDDNDWGATNDDYSD